MLSVRRGAVLSVMLVPAGLLLQQGMTVGVLLFTELGGVEEVGRELFPFLLAGAQRESIACAYVD